MTLSSGCPGAIKFRDARPDYIECPHCGSEMETWTDEPVARCPQCGFWTTQERGASCIDWCQHAAECIGLDKYERLKKTRPPEPTTVGADS